MIEVSGNLWTYLHEKPIIRCITTNGMVKRDGTCVMGRGCAKEAAKVYPELPKLLGSSIKIHGNVVRFFPHLGSGDAIIVFPVKHRWMEPADLTLIRDSAETLNRLALKWNKNVFLLPRPGCGNGRLKWEDVKPLLEFLPDNVLVITKEAGGGDAPPGDTSRAE